MAFQIKKREAEAVLKKLRLEPAGRKHHPIYLFRYKGKTILKTRYSFGRGDMKGHAGDNIRSQLHLNEQQMREAIACPFEYDDFVKLLKEKGLIPD
jgi:hypothetical protein